MMSALESIGHEHTSSCALLQTLSNSCGSWVLLQLGKGSPTVTLSDLQQKNKGLILTTSEIACRLSCKRWTLRSKAGDLLSRSKMVTDCIGTRIVRQLWRRFVEFVEGGGQEGPLWSNTYLLYMIYMIYIYIHTLWYTVILRLAKAFNNFLFSGHVVPLTTPLNFYLFCSAVQYWILPNAIEYFNAKAVTDGGS